MSRAVVRRSIGRSAATGSLADVPLRAFLPAAAGPEARPAAAPLPARPSPHHARSHQRRAGGGVVGGRAGS